MIAGLRAVHVALVILLAAASVRSQQPEKNPVPDDLSQGESRKAAADLYKRDYTAAKGNRAALAKLAQRMLDEAAKAKDQVVSYYVLLDLAKSVATEAGDTQTAMSAVDRIGESYEIDTLNVKADCLRKIGNSRTGDTDDKALAEQAFSLVDEAVAGNKYGLGKYEVTQAQWEAVMGNNPSVFRGNPSQPVERVGWDDIQSFLAKMNESPKNRAVQFVLPTEAQWEYACRAGTTTAFCFGEDEAELGQYGWIKANAGGKSHPVGRLLPNAWGLHDVHGNVWEWCADWQDRKYYDRSPQEDPLGPETGVPRVFRGGRFASNARMCRSALRNGGPPTFRDGSIGFRLAIVLAEKPSE